MKNGGRFAAATFFREPLAKKKDSKETSFIPLIFKLKLYL